ncbi:MAG: NBR1-Ig-like domain-containing protein, partial [Limisphaerales bacterium]
MKLRMRIGAVLFCFGTALVNFNCFAQENGALVSDSITNGTPVAPRSMFTQTWTFQNTGTTTWTAGPNGYTLDMAGLDTLGAIPFDTNSSGTYHFPRAAINSGKSVAPGGTASYSMEFIAPEASGSYTDSFQLDGTNWFGPTVTVQVAVEPGGNTNVFDRSRTISYANNYAPYVCSDGYFWTNTDYPDFGFYGTGVFTAVPTGAGLDGGIGDDCAHFVSCCIGDEAHVRGGGINIPNRTPPTYGEPSAPDIVVDRLLGPGYAVEVSSLKQLEPGDVIGWNWYGDTNIIDLNHVTLYEGNNLMASHAIS